MILVTHTPGCKFLPRLFGSASDERKRDAARNAVPRLFGSASDERKRDAARNAVWYKQEQDKVE
jgi:hypothetical protein